MGDHSADAVAGSRFRGRTVQIVVVAETEETDFRPLAEAIHGALGIATDANVRMKTFEPDDEIGLFDPPYELECPLCGGTMVAIPTEGGRVILECTGECRRAWSVPQRTKLTLPEAAP